MEEKVNEEMGKNISYTSWWRKLVKQSKNLTQTIELSIELAYRKRQNSEIKMKKKKIRVKIRNYAQQVGLVDPCLAPKYIFFLQKAVFC